MKIRLIASFVAAVALGISIPAFGESLTNPSGEQQVRVCVNKDTKTVKYFKKRQQCPANSTELLLNKKGNQGVQGVPGRSGSNAADFFTNCFQKRGAAIASGAYLTTKSDRNAFERETGCKVEEVRDEIGIQVNSASGMPVIADWEITSIGEISEITRQHGFESARIGAVNVQVEIANFDAVSELGGSMSLCLFGGTETTLTQVSGSLFEGTSLLYSYPNALYMQIGLGFEKSRRYGTNCNWFPNGVMHTIYVDPRNVPSEYVRAGWGW